MNITIVGPGAVGTLLGGLLQLSGVSVTLRGRRAVPAPSEPLRILLPGGWLLAEGLRRESPEDPVGSPNLFLVTLARHHLHSVRRADFLRLIGDSAPVAFCNADPVEAERLAVPSVRLFRFCTLWNAVKLQESEVELTTEEPAIVVERQPVLLGAVQGLASRGIRVIPVDDVGPFVNSLFLYQLLFLPVAMCNTTLEAFLSVPEGRELALRVLQEGFSAADRAGLAVSRLPAQDPWDLASRLEKKPSGFDAERHVPGRAYNSVLQSYLLDRPSEAAQLNRRIVEIASEAGLHLTWNWRLFQKASRIGSVGYFRDPAELLRALV